MNGIIAFLAAAGTGCVLATALLAQAAFPVRTVKSSFRFPEAASTASWQRLGSVLANLNTGAEVLGEFQSLRLVI
jgi:hypothetical protein